MTIANFETIRPYLGELLDVLDRQQDFAVDETALAELAASLPEDILAYVVFKEPLDSSSNALILNQFQSQITQDNQNSVYLGIAAQVASMLSIGNMTLEQLNDILDPPVTSPQV